MAIKLALVYGGKSAEHQVSLQTARAVINALDKNKFDIYPIYITEQGQWVKGKQLNGPVESVEDLKFLAGNSEAGEKGEHLPVPFSQELFNAPGSADPVHVVFPLLHGPNGEDGTIQGMLELLNIPYVGNGVLASAAGMDKIIMKNLFAQAGLAQAKYVWFTNKDWEKDKEEVFQKVEEQLGYPCFVKPANLGSSVGISKAKDRQSLIQSIEEAFLYDRKLIIEESIDGREVEIGVIGNDEPICSVVGEIAPKKEFYDYKAKYEDGDTELIIPADITEEQYEQIKKMALKAFKAIDGSGLVRADFFLRKDGTPLINEVNTMPGFTPFSMFPLLWKHSGIDYPALIEKLVQLGIERYELKQRIKYTI
ncbi:D-alanine--D-alanine ligase [Aeribacillus composti]|uniref:D-alanine--D-alanine ligase n=1 Tax=Aeribacillus TaxID=1055323 RepID=UPI00119AD823|nr:D-alanine--D-alanine ligase [Aeribacillus composti]MED0714607.1 D-alanine--D-alanine ligase [Aeribacillus composti]MED0745648.1 D-alanine--D-alanine ligase [Aeribacillus composti]TVZ87561.1 D-alanine--D-alanine ligase [Aeribacillus composti]BBU38052.1 D-alanine--D-alanine ligase [Aeribacillus pallidus]